LHKTDKKVNKAPVGMYFIEYAIFSGEKTVEVLAP